MEGSGGDAEGRWTWIVVRTGSVRQPYLYQGLHRYSEVTSKRTMAHVKSHPSLIWTRASWKLTSIWRTGWNHGGGS